MVSSNVVVASSQSPSIVAAAPNRKSFHYNLLANQALATHLGASAALINAAFTANMSPDADLNVSTARTQCLLQHPTSEAYNARVYAFQHALHHRLESDVL